MSDARIASTADLRWTIADWLLLPNGLLDETQELANYVKVALLTDRLAAVTEVLPDPDSDDRRGWWGDMDAGVIWRGWTIGTKNWLLTRAKIADSSAWEGDTTVRAENYTREALTPLLDMKLCSRIDVSAARVSDQRIDVLVRVWRGPESAVDMVFQDLWNEMRTEEMYSDYRPAPLSKYWIYFAKPQPFWLQGPRFAFPDVMFGGLPVSHYSLAPPDFAQPNAGTIYPEYAIPSL